MRKINLLFCFLFLSLLSLPCFAINNFTIVNHFGSPIKIEITRNGHVIPDIPEKFLLQNHDSIRSRVVSNEDEAFLRIVAFLLPIKSAFLGVDHNAIHGYIDKGIAYSWTNVSEAIVTICTPSEYKKNGGHC